MWHEIKTWNYLELISSTKRLKRRHRRSLQNIVIRNNIVWKYGP